MTNLELLNEFHTHLKNHDDYIKRVEKNLHAEIHNIKRDTYNTLEELKLATRRYEVNIANNQSNFEVKLGNLQSSIKGLNALHQQLAKDVCAIGDRANPVRIPFTIADYMTGSFNVVTRDGRKAQVIKIRLPSEKEHFPVLAVIYDLEDDDNEAYCETFSPDGLEFVNREGNDDLFLVPKGA